MLSLYLHIPFCTHRCAYCDFNTYAGQEAVIPAYVEALCREIEFVGRTLRATPGLPYEAVLHTVFFGGGTPSLLSPSQFGSIFTSIRDHFTLTQDAEITIEANPGTVSYEHLSALRELGINRISYGVQSANSEELSMLERTHDFFDVIEAVTSARKAGFDRQSHGVNIDLIYGLPGQSLHTWQTTVGRVLALHPEHISAYALTLEHGTPFGRWAARGWLPLPDPDLAADMYEWLHETLEEHGYVQYEISNWAQDANGHELHAQPVPVDMAPAFACRHNLQYWRGLPYLAVGAGAHGYVHGYRYANVLRIKTYIDRMTDQQIDHYAFPRTPATANYHKQSLSDEISEFMMTGLRLTREGVSEKEFRLRFGKSLHDVYGREVEDLLRLGLIERAEPERIRLTARGRLLGNQAFLRFVEGAPG